MQAGRGGKNYRAFLADLNCDGRMLKFGLILFSGKGDSGVIKVDGSRPVDAARTARTRTAAPSGVAFSLVQAEDTRSAACVSGPSPIGSVEALIALQEMSSSTTGRARAARRGKDMLDLLDDVRDGLLAGHVSRDTLQRLVQLVGAKREDFVDPGLSSVMDEIDLRARVELAKLNFADAR
jgi:hypothetical protein